jgi:hypothetical protein
LIRSKKLPSRGSSLPNSIEISRRTSASRKRHLFVTNAV